MTSGSLEVLPVEGIGDVLVGDSIAELVARAIEIKEGDVVVISHKIVSKAEGRVAPFDGSSVAHRGIIDHEAVRVLRERSTFVIAETEHGFVCTNAGVDLANAPVGTAVLLPRDPDRSARRIRDGISRVTGKTVGVVVADAFGRPWRRGTTAVAIGSAGVAAVIEGERAPGGEGAAEHRTPVCVADEIAGAADLVMGRSRRIPAAIVRGVDPKWLRRSSVRSEVVRSHDEDLFR